METDSKFNCPLCGGAMTIYKDKGGVMVTCYNPCDPQCHENVFGHGSNERNAYEIACEKFPKIEKGNKK